jgi:hypothetical protein
MEAKDTVIKPAQVYDLIGYGIEDVKKQSLLLEKQAEMSFKAGYHQREIDPLDKEDRCEKCYEQGIKEVVDWIEKNKIEVPTLYNIEINYHEWQFKKNAWGIKEENNGNNK